MFDKESLTAWEHLYGQGQRLGSRSKVSVKFLALAVDIWGGALLSACSIEQRSHYQSKVFVCVSVNSGHVRIISFIYEELKI